MEPWLAPICDNLNYLMTKNMPSDKQDQVKTRTGSKGQKIDPYLSLMMEKGIIEVEAIAYIRGRSIPDSYIVIDEAQNLTIHELKTIITRVGENTKIILTGDVEQIDNAHVDAFTNGLSYAIEKFKGSRIAGHVTLMKGERSELATEASKIL
jgi:PhoH-like ATPase